MMRLTIPDVVPFLSAYREKPGNSSGGSLHIVIDDGNYANGHIEFCREYAAERGDADGVELADMFSKLTRTQRRKICRLR
jgi:hypothetical protein